MQSECTAKEHKECTAQVTHAVDGVRRGNVIASHTSCGCSNQAADPTKSGTARAHDPAFCCWNAHELLQHQDQCWPTQAQDTHLSTRGALQRGRRHHQVDAAAPNLRCDKHNAQVSLVCSLVQGSAWGQGQADRRAQYGTAAANPKGKEGTGASWRGKSR
jgi:hypothetical protein